MILSYHRIFEKKKFKKQKTGNIALKIYIISSTCQNLTFNVSNITI